MSAKQQNGQPQPTTFVVTEPWEPGDEWLKLNAKPADVPAGAVLWVGGGPICVIEYDRKHGFLVIDYQAAWVRPSDQPSAVKAGDLVSMAGTAGGIKPPAAR